MGDSTYFLTIEDESANGGDGQTIAFAYGDLTEVSFIAKRRIKQMEAAGANTFSVRFAELTDASALGLLSETDGSLEPDGVRRDVTSFTGDGGTAAIVLKRKLAQEKAEQAASPVAQGGMPTPESEAAGRELFS